MNLINVALGQFALDDRTFDLGFARRYEALKRSVAEVGVLQPPVARSRADDRRLQIVCGFGRALAAQDLHISHLPVSVLDPTTSDADGLRLALFDNLPNRQFNPIERAIILAKLGKYVNREHLLSDYMPLLGIQPSGELLNRTLSLAGLADRLKWAIAEGRIEEKAGVSLASLSADDQEFFGRLLEQCHPSVSVAREWAEALTDIARRDHRPLHEILAIPEVAAVLDSKEMTDAERTGALRRCFHRLRYPAMSACEERFDEARAALRLPPSMRLEPTPNFESNEMRLEIRFRNEAELRHAATLLSRWFDDPLLLKRLWQAGRKDKAEL